MFKFLFAVTLTASLLFLPYSHVIADEKDTTISVLVGGFDPDGVYKNGPFGIAKTQNLIKQMAEMLKVPDGTVDPMAPNQIVQVEYYGKVAPKYYTAKNTKEIESAGIGTPRYALIAAKFIKHRLALTGATKVNLCGGSYGGLISRYIIEQDVEGLASSGKIARWLTIEGAVCGAYPANLTLDDELRKFFEKELGLNLSDPITMNYVWIEKNINKPRTEGASPFFKNILIGHQISSNSNLFEGALSAITGKASDGVLLVEDMQLHSLALKNRFQGKLPATVTIGTTHPGVKDDSGLWANIHSFAKGDRRATIRIVEATAKDFTEDAFWFGKGEVAYQGKVHSPHSSKAWKIDKEIALINRENHTAKVISCSPNEAKEVDSKLFDWMLSPEERNLSITLWAEEIDWDDIYKVAEDFEKPFENLGETNITVPVDQQGTQTYIVETEKWKLTLEVEVFQYQ